MGKVQKNLLREKHRPGCLRLSVNRGRVPPRRPAMKKGAGARAAGPGDA
jgi:hypothetical protein